MTSEPRRVLHLVHTWGMPSHTFIRSAVSGVTGYAPIVVCEHRYDTGIATDPVPLHTLRWSRRLPAGLRGKAMIAATAWHGRGAALVHTHFWHEAVLANRVAAVLRRPWVASLHGHDALVDLREPRRARERAALAQAAAVTVPSEFLAGHVRALGVAPERVVIAPSGVDLAELAFRVRRRATHEPTEVLFIGRFVDKKGVLDATAAVVQAAERTPLHAHFVGSGPLEHLVRDRLEPLGDRARITDGSDRAVVLAALERTHLLVSPSVTAPDGDADTLLIVNLEAQACGVPVVTTRHGGIPTAVDPDAAVLVDEGDVDAIADALVELASDPARWEAMGSAGRRFVEAAFTQEQAAARLAACYDELLADDERS